MKSLFLLFLLLSVALTSNCQERFIKSNNVMKNGQKRLALVIGNSAYKDEYLKVSKNDADSMSKTLSDFGFDVLYLADGTSRQINIAINNFISKSKDYNVEFFYYSGHGVSKKDSNYIIPIDFTIDKKSNEKAILEEFSRAAINVDLKITKALKQLPYDRINFCIWDACRNDFYDQVGRILSSQIKTQKYALQKGLDRQSQPIFNLNILNPTQQCNVCTFYATSENRMSSALFVEPGDNSPFTKLFLKNIRKPGVKSSYCFADVIDDFGKLKIHMPQLLGQEPQLKNNMSHEFIFFDTLNLLQLPIVEINGRKWFKKNADVTVFRNGEKIDEANSKEAWVQCEREKRGCWCYYDNSSEFGKYGKLYNWYAINSEKGFGFLNWRVPTDEEFNVLKRTQEFELYTAEFGGYRTKNGVFDNDGKYNQFWSSSKSTESKECAYIYEIDMQKETSSLKYVSEARGYPVRLIQDENTLNSDELLGKNESVDLNKNEILPEVKIGNQIWTRNNVDITTYSDGSSIKEGNSFEKWKRCKDNKEGCWCYYDYNSQNAKFGKLYNWYAVSNENFSMPGWHLPTLEEWNLLIDACGGIQSLDKIKSTCCWESTLRTQENLISDGKEFGALPGGILNGALQFNDLNKSGYWWSNSLDAEGVPSVFILRNEVAKSTSNLSRYKQDGCSVRLIKNQ